MRDGILVEIDLSMSTQICHHADCCSCFLALDPYLLNILPASTVPTSIYIAILTLIAIPLSAVIQKGLYHVARLETPAEKQKGTSNKPDDHNKRRD